MASVYSAYTQTGTYTKTRVRVDYSGTTAVAHLLYTRTNSNTTPTGGVFTFTFAGQTTSGTKSFVGQQTDAEIASVSFSIPTSGGHYSGSCSSGGGYLDFNGSVDIPNQVTYTPPAIPSCTVKGRTYNSITGTATCSDFGHPQTSHRGIEFIVGTDFEDDSGQNYDVFLGHPRLVEVVFSEDDATEGSGTGTVTNDSLALEGGVTLCGCLPVTVGSYANTDLGTEYASRTYSTLYYLPPAPLTSLTAVVTSQNVSNITYTVHVVGSPADGVSNMIGAKVDVQYRCSFDNGSTWGNWNTIASDVDPDEEQTGTFNAPYNQSIKVQARQVANLDTSQASEVKEITLPPIFASPTLSKQFDQLRRRLTVTAALEPGVTGVKKLVIQYSYDANFTNIFETAESGTGQLTFTHNNSYYRPTSTLYIRAKVVGTLNESSAWETINLTVPRPIWGVVRYSDGTQKYIVDLVRKRANNTIGPRNWIDPNIDGGGHGSNRIVRKP